MAQPASTLLLQLVVVMNRVMNVGSRSWLSPSKVCYDARSFMHARCELWNPLGILSVSLCCCLGVQQYLDAHAAPAGVHSVFNSRGWKHPILVHTGSTAWLKFECTQLHNSLHCRVVSG
jgi:hypothetical protein